MSQMFCLSLHVHMWWYICYIWHVHVLYTYTKCGRQGWCWCVCVCACMHVCMHMHIKMHYHEICKMHCIHYHDVLQLGLYNYTCMRAHMNTMSGSVHVVYIQQRQPTKQTLHIYEKQVKLVEYMVPVQRDDIGIPSAMNPTTLPLVYTAV